MHFLCEDHDKDDRPREVFADAIADYTASIIVAHNHPSGSLETSQIDKDITIRLVEAGKLLDIVLGDHLIVTAQGYQSIL